MIDLILKGRWFMGPLMLCSIVGLAVIIDRFFYLRRAIREAEDVLARIDKLNEAGDIDGLQAFCEAHPSLLTKVFREGIHKYKQLQGEPNLDFIQAEINKIMEDASLLNTVDLERRLPMLSTVGNVAPLFGFAGTVTGMMDAFEKIAAEANVDASKVAGGIREALITTAAGLVIAIPCVLAYNYFMHQIDALNARVEESANGLMDSLVMLLVRRDQAAPGAGAARLEG